MKTLKRQTCIVNVPTNIKKFCQPLDLTVNGCVKRFLKRKLNEWYLGQVKAQLDDGISIDDVQVGLLLTKLKPLHAGWLVGFHNHVTTSKRKEIIDKAAGIFDVLEHRSSKMPSIYPFHNIDPILSDNIEQPDVIIEEFELLFGNKIQDSGVTLMTLNGMRQRVKL